MTSDVGIRTRVLIGLTLALAVAVAWPGENRRAVWAQEDEYVFFFRVRDAASGALVTDLTPEEFVVSLDGVPCDVVSAELVATRLQLAIVLDDTGAMRRFDNHLRNGMPQFLDALPEGRWVSLGDGSSVVIDSSEVSFITMAQRPNILMDFSTDMAQVREGFEDYFVQPSSGAAFLDTLVQTTDNLMKEDGEAGVPEGGAFWPHIAVIGSDGGDVSRGNPTTQINELGQKLQELGATVHWLMLETVGAGIQHQLSEFLTTGTGGWRERMAGPSQSVVEKIAEMGAIITERYAARANQYRVVFTPPAGSEATTGFAAGVARPGVTVQVSTDGRLQ